MKAYNLQNILRLMESMKKHIDRCTNFVVRKLSLSILLNNPNDYEGGDLKFF